MMNHRSEVGEVLYYMVQLFYCNHLARPSSYEISTSASLRYLQSEIQVTSRFTEKNFLTLFTTDADYAEYLTRYCCLVPCRMARYVYDFHGSMSKGRWRSAQQQPTPEKR